MANHELSEQEIVRRNSMNALRERGIEPYPAAEYPVTLSRSKRISRMAKSPCAKSVWQDVS
jgi:hypothetical protein